MPVDLLAFDLDGTVLNSQSELSKANRNALRKAHKRGVRLVPCTGRSLYELPTALNQLIDEFGFTIFPYIITDNGAQIYDLPNRELLYTKNLPEKTALHVMNEGRKRLVLTYGCFCIGGAVDNRGKIWETKEARPFLAEFEKKWRLPTADLEELIKWNNGLVKISMNFMYTEDYEKSMTEFAAFRPALSLSSSMERNLEIMIAGISKGEAVRFVSDHSGIPLSRIMTIGDNLNDMEMICEAGFGVAMGNAIQELKEKADWVTATNDDDGFTLALEKMLDEASC